MAAPFREMGERTGVPEQIERRINDKTFQHLTAHERRTASRDGDPVEVAMRVDTGKRVDGWIKAERDVWNTLGVTPAIISRYGAGGLAASRSFNFASKTA